MALQPDVLADALRDRYQLVRELGRGGMATVWLAQDLRHDRPVALKVLHPELAASLGPERFLREIHTAGRLQHPHILPVLDSGHAACPAAPTSSGTPCRTSRARRCASGSAGSGQLPVDEALRIARRRSRWRWTTPTGTAWSTAT